MAGRTKLYVSLCCFIVGIVFIIVGGICFGIINTLYNNALEEAGVVSSTDDEGYEDFVNPPDDTRFRRIVYIFNYTNYETMLLTGGKSIIKEVGPFAYYFKVNKLKVKFFDNGVYVNYTSWYEYELILEESIGDPKNIIITAPNPTYMAILYIAGLSESQLLIRKEFGKKEINNK